MVISANSIVVYDPHRHNWKVCHLFSYCGILRLSSHFSFPHPNTLTGIHTRVLSIECLPLCPMHARIIIMNLTLGLKPLAHRLLAPLPQPLPRIVPALNTRRHGIHGISSNTYKLQGTNRGMQSVTPQKFGGHICTASIRAALHQC
jgi:hypothetical protein